MDSYQSRASASEVYLISNWHQNSNPPAQRRKQLFHEFVGLGSRGRWPWHARAEGFNFNPDEKEILEGREWRFRNIGWRLGVDTTVAVIEGVKHDPRGQERVDDRGDGESTAEDEGGAGAGVEQEEVEVDGDDGDEDDDDFLHCGYDGNPFDVLPELVYSMTAFDDPDDVAEARLATRDQSLWVTGVFWLRGKLVWVDEFGETVREKECGRQQVRAVEESFNRSRHFESVWWTEATRIGKYAREDWWE